MADKDFRVKNRLHVNGLTNTSGVILATNNALDSHTNVPTQYGGTGTTQSPAAGQVLFSSAGTTYTPTTLTSLDVKGATYSADAPANPVVGQVWIESDSSSDSFDPNIMRRKTITATAGQTTFTTDLEFIQGYEQVYFNGMLLLRTSDYTTPSNTSVVLTAAAAAGDIVEILSITNLNSINAATTTTNTFTGAQTINLSSPAVPLTLRAASSGSSNLLNILNGSGTAIGAISSSGELSLGSNSFLGGSNRLIVSGNTMINAGTDITPDVNGAGHLRIGGNGYTGFATLDATGMWLGHNSSARSLIFATDETERMRIDGSGKITINAATGINVLNVGGNISTYFSPSSYPNMRGIIEHSGQTAGVRIISQGVNLGTDVSGAISFWTSSSSSANASTDANISERMRINANGDVNIGGASNPGDTLRFFDIYNANAGNSAGSIIRLITNNSSNTGLTTVDIVRYRNGNFVITNNEGPTIFNNNGAERMRIGSGGGVSIGSTNTTSHKLFIEDSGTVDTLRTWNTNSNFTAHVYQAMATRGQTSAYFFYSAYSSGGGDAEFWVRGDGQVASDSSYTSNGADYAEYFEWADGNPNNEDRVGLTVSLVDDKIKIAEEGESPVGIISGSPSVVGDNAFNSWSGKYLKDDFGRYLRDENGDRILNPEYDSELEYVSRESRPEWAIVGLMGKLRLRKGQVTGAGWIKMRDISETVEEWLVK